jgi:hypothetical protein
MQRWPFLPVMTILILPDGSLSIPLNERDLASSREELMVPPLRPRGWIFRVPLAACLLSLIPLPSSVFGQSPAESVRAFATSASGFLLRDRLEEGALEAGGEFVFPVELPVGADHMVVGFCGPDCGNLDLVVLDPAGMEVASDHLPDAQPALMIRPETRGLHQVRVEMVACAEGACDFAVGILEGGTPEGLASGAERMEDRLGLFRLELTRDGYAEVGMPESGTLNQGQEIQFPANLLADLDYVIAGVCDNDCENLDLFLLSPSGQEVASDVLSDAVPLLEVTPEISGDYRIGVRVLACSWEPCGFLLSTFVRGAGVGPGGVTLKGVIVLERTLQGALEAGDRRRPRGEFFDEYSVQAEVGQTVIVDLRSPEFDTFLIVEGPEGVEAENDDWGDDTMHSHVELVARKTGVFSIRVSTFMADETGGYTLQIAVVQNETAGGPPGSGRTPPG